MTRRQPITDRDVALAFARSFIEKTTPNAILCADGHNAVTAMRAICRAARCDHDVIDHCGDVSLGWLTPAGIALLDPETAEQYRAAVTQKQRITS